MPPKAEAQTGTDCSYKNYEWESYRCFDVFNSCQKACSDQAKGSYLDEVSPADKYDACMKASDCHGKTQACRDQAWANYQACKNAGKNEEKAPKEAVKEEKTPLEKLSDMPVFIGEWFERVSLAWVGLIMQDAMIGIGRELITEPEIAMLKEEEAAKDYIYTLSDEYVKDVTGYTKAELKLREPRISDPIIQKLKQGGQKSSLEIIAGLGQIKEPGSNQFIPLTSKETPIVITFIDATIRSTSDNLQLGYTWGVDAGSVIDVSPQTEIQFLKPVQDEQTQDVTATVKLNLGEVEVKTKNNSPQNKFKIEGGSLSVVAPRTHFWVSKNTDKNQTVVGIYEGEVQITTKDGKTTSLFPNGDKPGVMIITQKLSPIKLAIAGLLAAGVIGGIIWFIKKRSQSKLSKKKK